MDIDPSVIENINSIWATPYGVTAKWTFIIGVAFMFVLAITRQGMSVKDAVLALVGLKPVAKRDLMFNLLHFGVILVPLVLLAISMQIAGT